MVIWNQIAPSEKPLMWGQKTLTRDFKEPTNSSTSQKHPRSKILKMHASDDKIYPVGTPASVVISTCVLTALRYRIACFQIFYWGQNFSGMVYVLQNIRERFCKYFGTVIPLDWTGTLVWMNQWRPQSPLRTQREIMFFSSSRLSGPYEGVYSKYRLQQQWHGRCNLPEI